MFICITAYSLADPQNGPLAPRCLRHFITSMPPLGCYRLERKLPGGFTPPLEFCAFSRRTRTGSEGFPRYTPGRIGPAPAALNYFPGTQPGSQ